MNPQTERDLLLRLGRLEKQSVRYRQGEITSLSPLSVALGGADTAYTSVRALKGVALAVGDVVSVAIFGNDLIILGVVATIPVPTPTAVTFAGAWVNFAAGLHTVAYYKDGGGRVHLRGAAKSGTIGTTIFTLPVGYRPTAVLLFPVVSNDAFGFARVESDGDVLAQGGSNVYFSLDGISFRAEQ